QSGPGRAVFEGVVLEPVVVREHEMQPVTQIAGGVAAHQPAGRRLDVEAVARLSDEAAVNAEAVGVPDVDPRAPLARVLARDALDDAVFDRAAVGLSQVDAEQRADDTAAAHPGV